MIFLQLFNIKRVFSAPKNIQVTLIAGMISPINNLKHLLQCEKNTLKTAGYSFICLYIDVSIRLHLHGQNLLSAEEYTLVQVARHRKSALKEKERLKMLAYFLWWM